MTPDSQDASGPVQGRPTLSSRLWDAFKYLTLALAAFIVIAPVYSVLNTSLKTSKAIQDTPSFAPPPEVTLANYLRFIDESGVGRAFLNTGMVMVAALFVTIALSSMAAYVLARFEFRGKFLILMAYAAMIAVPGVVTQVSTFQVMLALHLVNTKWALVVLYAATDIVTLFILMEYIKSIPRELDESARVEGAGYIRIWWEIILPLMRPAIATVIILRSIGIYNDFVLPYLYAPDPGDRMVSTLLFAVAGPNMPDVIGVVSAGVIVVIIPSLIVFFLLQKHIFAGIIRGATKG